MLADAFENRLFSGTNQSGAEPTGERIGFQPVVVHSPSHVYGPASSDDRSHFVTLLRYLVLRVDDEPVVLRPEAPSLTVLETPSGCHVDELRACVPPGPTRLEGERGLIGGGLDLAEHWTKILEDVVDGLHEPWAVADQAMGAAAGQAVHKAGKGRDLAVPVHQVAGRGEWPRRIDLPWAFSH